MGGGRADEYWAQRLDIALRVKRLMRHKALSDVSCAGECTAFADVSYVLLQCFRNVKVQEIRNLRLSIASR